MTERATTELESIVERYERRKHRDTTASDILSISAYLAYQERNRMLVRWIREYGLAPVESRKLMEVGCGTGNNLLDFLRLGFRPENMLGNDLLADRVRLARRMLPQGLAVLEGNALELDIPKESFDIVFQATVFTSILDPQLQQALADRMWTWLRPGGGILWYDFVYDNPRNSDVKGVPLSRVRELFPDGRVSYRRVTLAPPISRLVTRISPTLYSVFNMIPPLRTHVLCWIEKR
jgi:Methylase involved in ubiquinone/menaquinone biosynthesis